MTYTQNLQNHSTTQNPCECEFTVPIKLNVPITITPELKIKSVPSEIKHKLPVVLQPDLTLEPEVTATAPECHPPNCETNGSVTRV